MARDQLLLTFQETPSSPPSPDDDDGAMLNLPTGNDNFKAVLLYSRSHSYALLGALPEVVGHTSGLNMRPFTLPDPTTKSRIQFFGVFSIPVPPPFLLKLEGEEATDL